MTLFFSEMDFYNMYTYTLAVFSDEPSVFVQPTKEGIRLGYHTVTWNSQAPVPSLATRHVLSWASLTSITREEQEIVVKDCFLKTVKSRKR
jgi:hypothetical protein